MSESYSFIDKTIKRNSTKSSLEETGRIDPKNLITITNSIEIREISQ